MGTNVVRVDTSGVVSGRYEDSTADPLRRLPGDFSIVRSTNIEYNPELNRFLVRFFEPNGYWTAPKPAIFASYHGATIFEKAFIDIGVREGLVHVDPNHNLLISEKAKTEEFTRRVLRES